MINMNDYLLRIKKIIIANIEDGDFGLYFSSDESTHHTFELLFYDGIRLVKICRHWSYFEVFGLTEAEQANLKEFYENIGGAI